ncbi:MAG TPA: site-2 protease family protein [Acidiferrobacterales bacterium]|nr:site-2 protease family protein [Acidiferrobacterales bacterium]
MEDLSQLQRISVWILPVIFAITVHEVAHGWVAKKLGDPTAQRLGRLTLNPIKHIDPIGTILVPGLLLLLGGFVFGWAKPVPVTWENLKHPKRDMALVAAAGPGANFIMAILWGMVAKVGMLSFTGMQWAAQPMVYMGLAGVAINIALMVLNLLPLPPLDGGRVMTGLLPGPWAWQLSRLEPYGFFILLALMVSGLLGRIIGPPFVMVQNLVFSLLGVS